MPIRLSLVSSRRLLSTLAAAALSGALLAGCATGGARLSNPAASAGAYRDTIDLNGRLLANYTKDGQPQSINGSFTWAQQPGRIDVALIGPLNQTVAEIHVTPQSATLVQAKRAPRVAKDIDTLTREALGFALPVNGLRDWLQGYATDANGKRFSAAPANDSVFTNDGWKLRFVEWQDGPEGSAGAVPRIVSAERSAGADGEALAIRIVIDPAN